MTMKLFLVGADDSSVDRFEYSTKVDEEKLGCEPLSHWCQLTDCEPTAAVWKRAPTFY